MSELEKTIVRIEEQEMSLVFDAFGSEAALEIGMLLVQRAKAERLGIAVNVTKGAQVLFHHALEGTSPDNDHWVRRKNNTVYRFHMSSYRFGQSLKNEGTTMQQRFGVSDAEFCESGGAVPVRVRDVGVVGTVTVSGLAEEDDHELVVWAMREHLNGK